MSRLTIDHVTKRFGDLSAVEDVSLEIRSGEFFSLLGPSGCGKTTLLRIIAGLELPTSGRVFIDDVDVTSLAAQRRETVMVFQNYALFPHMTVSKNVAFGLEAKHVPHPEIKTRVSEALSLVQLEHKTDAAIQDLSGGEQQRVALARAIVVRPKILLMDEPLSNLDITLRGETRTQIKNLQLATGITTIYVTHDQSEALGLSDRIAVLLSGQVVQVGTPKDLYTKPRHVFVASFLGNATVLRAKVSIVESGIAEVVVNEDLRFHVETVASCLPGMEVLVAVRPEHVQLTAAGDVSDFRAIVESVEYQGTTTEYRIRVGDQVLRSVMNGSHSPEAKPGDGVGVRIDPMWCFIYPSPEEQHVA
jgi:ABC-type Fe3+/spermidine/putrescine transport system ATPase subunit